MSQRDHRFVATHRGGQLPREHHDLMAAWAAGCAEYVLPLFESQSSDQRPIHAIAMSRAWARGEISVGEARDAALGAHAAAREMSHGPAIAAARAAGHAAATAHMADHCLTAFHYALRAISADGGCIETEKKQLFKFLPQSIFSLVKSRLQKKYPNA